MNKNNINRLIQICFIFLGFVIPISIAATNTLLVLLILLWLLQGGIKQKLIIVCNSYWIISIFFLILLYIAGLFWGDNHNHALWEFQRLSLLLVFPILYTLKLKKETIRAGVVSFLSATFISALLAIAINNNMIFALGEYINIINKSWRNSAFIAYNYHNILLSFSFFISLYILIEKKTKYRCLLIVSCVVYTFSIFTEPGRAGQLLFNAFGLFYIFYYNKNRIIRLTILLLLLFGFQWAIYNTTTVYKHRINKLSEVIQNNGKNMQGKADDIRYVFFRETGKRIIKKPLFGYGTGSFSTIFDREVSSGHNFKEHITPHNNYLFVLFELGILGLISLFFIFYFQIKELLKLKDFAHRMMLPISFMFLMLIDSYLFVFILTTAYMYLYTIYSKY